MRFVFFLAIGAPMAFSAGIPKQVTFHRDVAPILQKNCQSCHRPGEAAPMSFLAYKDARPFAKAIKEAVLTKRMPPWFADPHAGKFANDSSLKADDIATLAAWADSGAKEGDAAHAPKPVQFVQGWNIGNPDLVVELPKPHAVPAKGTIDYIYYVLPLNLKEDTWISAAEVRPGNREVVHHVIAFVRPPGAKWLKNAPLGEPYIPKSGEGGTPFGQWVGAYAPGMPPDQMLPGQGRLLKAGSDVVLQMHYTANGKEATDKTRIGFVFAKEPVKERVVTLASANDKFEIPPGAPNHEVRSSITLREETKLATLMPHMHLRGKAFEMRAVYPSGETEVLLRVPRYDFNWQLIYRPVAQKVLPKGTKIECTAHFDNSANNKSNPDPSAAVRFGEQSWEEMMIGFFDVAVAPDMDASDVIRGRRKVAAAANN
jgi:hypothetical protein